MHSYILIFFFFQAEDGIRDDLVTGVQTCALPISEGTAMPKNVKRGTPNGGSRQKKHPEKDKKAIIRVLVAEDHTIVRDGLVALIRQQTDMDVVADAGDRQQTVELSKKHRPDINLI